MATVERKRASQLQGASDVLKLTWGHGRLNVNIPCTKSQTTCVLEVCVQLRRSPSGSAHAEIEI